jgi:excinuclease ABC subunit A
MAGRNNGSGQDRCAIKVRGARVHNLRDLDVDVPRDRLVVLTGLSGSGKSSLAFDTLFAEGQRRYLEGLSTYARQFLDQLERPDVDLIEGLPPTIAIDQHAGTGNPRSTVGTLTEIHDYLRLLYARTGLPRCPGCGREIRRQTPEQMVGTVLAMQAGRKVLVLAPLVRGRKGEQAEALQAIRRAGLIRARIDGQVVEVTPELKLAKTKTHTVEAVIDRLVVRDGIRPRLAESIDLALKLGDGSVLLSAQTDSGSGSGSGWDDRLLSVKFACPECGTGFDELEPRTFSFNSPYGACPACDGLGSVRAFDPDLIIPDRTLTLAAGAVVPWRDEKPAAPSSGPALTAFLKKRRLKSTTRLDGWTAAALELLLRGDPASGFEGIIPTLTRELAEAKTDRRRAALEEFRSAVVCPACGGARLRPEARAVTLGGKPVHAASALPIAAARGWFAGLEFAPPHDLVGPPLVREITARLEFLDRVGLGYLTLDRGTDTLSGGELQRVRLASQIGSGLIGVCYILDEPTAGLHPRDTERLLACLTELRDQGNTIVVVEHDEATIRAADWMIDLGPGAGPDGGRIVATGPPAAPTESDSGQSSTARFLRHEARIELPSDGRARAGAAGTAGWIEVLGAAERNLKAIDVKLPLGALTCVTGVSGSGKSTLVHEILARAVRRHLDRVGPRPGAYRAINGLGPIAKLIAIDQTPIGRGPRSTPATYTGVFDEIRKVFARTRDARLRGYGANRFSFNVKGGRCEACQGQGLRRIEMNFLPDLFVACDVCGGRRFNRQTLEIRFKGRSIGDVLALRVDESRAVFDAQPRVLRGLDALHEAGLGYITLGQASTTLSGGEAQRIKLAAELGRASGGDTLYVLDEPTTGLHFADVARLLAVLHRLAGAGNTVVVIEHNLDVIKTADWVIDLGPEGGDAGGRLVAQGTPRAVAQEAASYTGAFLKPLV